MHMRLADFIRAEMEPILKDWEAFADTLLHARNMDKIALRDHAHEMLLAIAGDLDCDQNDAEQDAKGKGRGPEDGEDSWAEVHGGDRHTSGFSVMETVSEFRALRASVVSLWTKALPTVGGEQLEDLTRFHEAIDQAVAQSLQHYSMVKEMDTRLFGAILLASPDPIYVLDPESRFVYANKAAADPFALEPKAIIGKSIFELGVSFASDFQRNLKQVMADQSIHRGKFVHTLASGQGVRFEYVLAPVLDESQNVEATVCISRDITKQALAEEEVWHNAHHDLLTGLPNRRLFLDRLEQEIKHAKRNATPIAVLYMDLDGFKEVNDSRGHLAGDRLLTAVAQRLTSCVRADDTVARLGGDEFAVILVEAVERSGAEQVARTIVEALSMPFDTAYPPVHISVSVGVTFFPRDAASPVALLEAADEAMYRAKKSGTSRVGFYDALHPEDRLQA